MAIDTIKVNNPTTNNPTPIGLNDIRIYTSETTTPDSPSYDGYNDYSGGIFLEPAEVINTSGDWKYFVDSMGICTCWRTISGSTTPAGSWNHAAVTDNFFGSNTQRTFPVTFEETPAIAITINSPYAWCYTGYNSSGGYGLSTTKAPIQSLATLSTSGSRAYRIEIVAVGRIAR